MHRNSVQTCLVEKHIDNASSRKRRKMASKAAKPVGTLDKYIPPANAKPPTRREIPHPILSIRQPTKIAAVSQQKTNFPHYPTLNRLLLLHPTLPGPRAPPAPFPLPPLAHRAHTLLRRPPDYQHPARTAYLAAHRAKP